MLEAEAKAKWCPFARVSSGQGREVGWNRREGESFGHREGIGGENHCIGSACMAWRFVPAESSALFHAAAKERAKTYGYLGRRSETNDRDVAYRNPPPGVDYDRHDGFCGLAGQPT